MAFGEEGHDGFHEGHNMMPSIIVIFLVVVLAIAGILLYKRFPSKTSGNKAEELNELSIKVLTERYAKGEISKKEFNSISHELELTEDESIEITKFRLAKGEISMKEYDEIVYTIGKRH
jgi:uncharacterized membrane protein